MACPLIILSHQKSVFLQQHDLSQDKFEQGFSTRSAVAHFCCCFNNVALLHTHKARTDKIRLVDVANEFVQRNENRFRNFGKFTDLDLSAC